MARGKGGLGLEAEGATPEEAETKLFELLQMQRDAKEGVHRLDIAPDPDEVALSDDEWRNPLPSHCNLSGRADPYLSYRQ